MTMRLSEAIRLAGAIGPQGKGNNSMVDLNAPCALGGALMTLGHKTETCTDGYRILSGLYPFLRKSVNCPQCADNDSFLTILFHLNDQHDWSRNQIADWLEPLEPVADGVVAPEVPEVVRV